MTLKNIKKGDVLVDRDKEERFVLARIGDLLVLSSNRNSDEFYLWETTKELESWGYTLKQPDWKPSLGDEYYFFDLYGEKDVDVWDNDKSDKWLYKTGNCFPRTAEGLLAVKEYKLKLLSLKE